MTYTDQSTVVAQTIEQIGADADAQVTALTTQVTTAQQAASDAQAAVAAVTGQLLQAQSSLAATAAQLASRQSARIPMPAADPVGWQRVWSDDFPGTALAPRWTPYSGQPGSEPYSWWSPTHVTVAQSVLTLAGYVDDTVGHHPGQVVTGGVGDYGDPLVHGRWDVCLRADPSPDVKYVALLWPNAPSTWPDDGEVDFAEDSGGDRSQSSGTLHWGSAATAQYRQDRAVVPIPRTLTEWHVLSVEWTAAAVRYLLDGQVWHTATAGVGGAVIPSKPMTLRLQAHAARQLPAGQAAVPANVQVDWVIAYKPAAVLP